EVQRLERALDAERENEAAIDHRARPRSRPGAKLRLVIRGIADAPLPGAGRSVETVHDLLAIERMKQDDATTGDRRPGVPLAFLIFPKLARAFLRPFVQEPGFGRGAVIVRAEK